MEETVMSMLRNRPWPLCCTASDIRMRQQEDEEFRWPLSIRWQATFEEIGTVLITPRMAACDQMRKRNMREIVAFLRSVIGFPHHYVNLVTSYGDRQGILTPGEVLEDSRGWVRIKISARGGSPTATIQLIPPKDGLLRDVRINIISRSRLTAPGRPLNSTCRACFRLVPNAADQTACRVCSLRPLCFRCVSSTDQEFCTLCITAKDLGTEAGLMRFRQFWFEVGDRYSRRRYEYPPYAQVPIADDQWEI